MTPEPRTASRRSKRLWTIFGPMATVALILFVIALQFVEPAPPTRFRLATGQAGGGYEGYAERLRDGLAANGIEVDLVPTAGSVENLDLLRKGTVDVAFLQGGAGDLDPVVAVKPEESSILALASLYYEPVWVFHRAVVPLTLLSDLRGRRIGVGAMGSGTRAIARVLLAENGIPVDAPGCRSVSTAEAAAALRAGTLDAAFFVGSPEDTSVGELLAAEGVELLDFVRAEAYARRHRYLSHVSLPRGVVDPARDLPRRTLQLVAPTAQLVAADSFHPALVDLLLSSADAVFQSGDWIQAQPEFPSSRYVEYPLSPIAKRFFRSGRPFLYRYLPFRLAAFLDRMKILLLPLLTLLFPLVKLVPPLYRWRVRSRIYRWYGDLLRIEADAGEDPPRDPIPRLDALAADVDKLSVPPSYADELYDLKYHIELVRDRYPQQPPTQSARS